MSDREVSNKEIDDKLEEIMESNAMTKTEQLFAKLLFNIRYDINELKLELLKVFKEDGDCEINHKEEEEDGRFYT